MKATICDFCREIIENDIIYKLSISAEDKVADYELCYYCYNKVRNSIDSFMKKPEKVTDRKPLRAKPIYGAVDNLDTKGGADND